MDDPKRAEMAWPFRFHLLFRPEHQPSLYVVLLVLSMAMGIYFWAQWWGAGGLLEFDKQAPIEVQFVVDVNSAEWVEFAILPGIGERLAKAIVEFRNQHGDFRSLEQLKEVPGIGPAKLEMLLPFLVLDSANSEESPDEIVEHE